MNNKGLPKLALIAGPTASGKSAGGIALAERHDGVVINADASQVYRDLHILTARPSPADETRVPHRLFGYIDGADACSAARWAADAKAAIAAVQAAGKLPILVGGTGLYLRTLLDGIAPMPAIDPSIREEVRALSVADSHRLLADEDPTAAARLAPADTTRVARALEVVRSTGRPIGDWQAQREGGIGGTVDLAAIRLLPDRDRLFAAIDQRSAAMLAAGAVDEAAALLARPDLPTDAPIRRAIGVPTMRALIDGAITNDQAIAELALVTRQYAKRQYTWFRNQPSAEWLVANDSCDINRLFDTLL